MAGTRSVLQSFYDCLHRGPRDFPCCTVRPGTPEDESRVWGRFLEGKRNFMREIAFFSELCPFFVFFSFLSSTLRSWRVVEFAGMRDRGLLKFMLHLNIEDGWAEVYFEFVGFLFGDYYEDCGQVRG